MMLKLWEIRYATYGKIFVGGGGGCGSLIMKVVHH